MKKALKIIGWILPLVEAVQKLVQSAAKK